MGYKYKVISTKTGNVLRFSNKKSLAEDFAEKRNERRKKVAKSTGRKFNPVVVRKV